MLNILFTAVVLVEANHPIFLFFILVPTVTAASLEMGLSLVFFGTRALYFPIRACTGVTPELSEAEGSARRPLMHFVT
jgi:hypothetical protein